MDNTQQPEDTNGMVAPDLRLRPPRSPRVRLGGYVQLPRMLDKGRASIAEQDGEYHYACPLDQHFLNFAGLDPELLRQGLVAGKGDAEILEWIEANAAHGRAPWEIVQWSSHFEARAPADYETREYFNGLQKEASLLREDIVTWFDLLDLDDYISFGGNA